MTGCAPDGPRVVLLNRDGRRGELLADGVAVELTRQLLATDAAADDFPRGLARSCTSLAAWLMDRVTLGAREWLASSGPDAGELVVGASIEARLARLSRAELLELVSQSLQLCHVSDEDADTWRQAQRRSLSIAERAAQLAKIDCPDRLADTRWWALYLTSPTGVLDDHVLRWTLESPSVLATSWATDHPWQVCLDCVCRAAADVDSSPELSLVDEDITCSNPSGSWRGLLPIALRMAHRTAQLEQEFQRTLEHEKLLAMKELAYGASHEINNPLANISSRAQLLLRDETDPERRRSLSTINSQAFRAHEMIADMMLFAKPPQPQREVIELRAFLEDLTDQLVSGLSDRVTLVRDISPGDWRCSCDPVQIAEAIRAIWSNALEAMGNAGSLRVAARVTTAADGSLWAEIELADDGPGIRPEVRRHLFDPFFSGREAGRGLGFGLSKAWRIVDLHGGQIQVASEVGQGATLTISLPLV